MPASKRVQRNANILSDLHNCRSSSTQKAILKGSSSDVINCLCEICLNILHGNVSLTPQQKAKLAPYKSSHRALAKKSTLPKRRRNILQKGFIGALLAPLLRTIITPLLSG